MSRHEIKGNSPQHECVVGYDAPLESYFVQVMDVKRRALAEEAAARMDQAIADNQPFDSRDASIANDDGMLLWIGTSEKELETVDALEECLRDYVTLSDDLRSRLVSDRAREAHPPTEFQKRMRELVRR